MNKKLIRLTESDLHRIVKESVNKVLNEVWDIDDNGIIDYDEHGRAKNRSYADVHGIGRRTPSDVRQSLMTTPHRDPRAETNYAHRIEGPNGWEHQDDTNKWLRPSDWFARGADGLDGDEFIDFDKQTSIRTPKDKRLGKALDAADKRPLHRNGSLNRA